MSKKRKTTKRNFNTKPASDRIFYRKPSLMLAEFFWSGTGLTVIPLAVLAGTLFLCHASFIILFS